MINIEKTERINSLLDLYRDLLTDKQQEIMDMYYLYDLSLSEIAEDSLTTRAAVYDLIKRTCKILENYESKLHLLEKRNKILEVIQDLNEDVKNKKISVNEGNTLINSKSTVDEKAYGKIIAQHTWYFIFDTSITDASVIRTGYYVTVDFPDKNIEDVTMKVHSVSELNGDTITVSLQCTSMNEDLANLRIENAAITVKDYNGFRISSNAIVENDEGLKGVYVVLGSFVKFTPISISYYGEDYVIANEYVAYKEDEDGKKVVDEEATGKYRKLGLYDKIIVKGMHIEDGMLIS